MSRSTSIPAVRLTPWLAAACLSASATLAPAATLTVNGSGDMVGVDGLCTLREAILSMNGVASVNADCVASGAYGTNDTIQFAIPGIGVRTISPASALPAVTATVLIDGYSQTGAAANSAANGWNGSIAIELDGTSAGASADGLQLLGSASTVRGLAIVNFNGNGIRFGAGVSGNSTGHTVAGCFLGLRPDGTAAGNNLYGVAFNALGDSDNNTLGGPNPADRNVASANSQGGILLNNPATGNTIRNNYIGVDPTGTADRGNAFNAIWINQASNTTVRDNLMSGNGNVAVLIQGNIATGNVVAGNRIGTDVAGTSALPNGAGALVASPNNTIGGTGAQDGNVIAFNAGFGVRVTGGATVGGVSILRNAIHSNGTTLGIDLGGDAAIQPNDAGDGDAGENGLQNYPVLVSASAAGAIAGTLDSTPSRSFRVELFSSASCPGPDFREGAVFVGFVDISTDGAGIAPVAANVGALTPGAGITATATDNLTGDTSEISACVVVAAAPVPAAPVVPVPALPAGGWALLAALLAAAGRATIRRRR